MDFRDVVVMLTDLEPETQQQAVEALRDATPQELDDFALFVARLLSLETGRTVGVWAAGALLALWRAEVELDVSRGARARDLAWPVIWAMRERCLPVLFELRTVWFGWNEWDDCGIIAPLATLRQDQWFDASANILFSMSTRSTPAAAEARRILDVWHIRTNETLSQELPRA